GAPGERQLVVAVPPGGVPRGRPRRRDGLRRGGGHPLRSRRVAPPRWWPVERPDVVRRTDDLAGGRGGARGGGPRPRPRVAPAGVVARPRHARGGSRRTSRAPARGPGRRPRG